ncbi:COATOMER SUBUNIT ZETA-2-LIKE [Salix viminalis]|uniref:COATOMER SUBUNIT ZETA-2-LIKE n=1 Tax=Salix viminalis TaxID=40686 RepID=A0A9Q0QDJ7_SALVM|nr:COATOMER SUBUNIT ZETA-2-LIKE [Salix viminalis]
MEGWESPNFPFYETLDHIKCVSERRKKGVNMTVKAFYIYFMHSFLLGSMILETDANVIAGKVAVNSMDPSAPLSEQTIGQALATAREHLTRTLFQ